MPHCRREQTGRQNRRRGCLQGTSGDITVESAWLSEHVGVLPEDRIRIDLEVWARLAGLAKRREAIHATGRVSEYELHPYHLLAYRGNR